MEAGSTTVAEEAVAVAEEAVAVVEAVATMFPVAAATPLTVVRKVVATTF